MARTGEVDKLVITVLVEDYAGYDTEFWGQHGIALLVEATAGSTTKRILFDTGQAAEPIIHNMKILGIEPSHSSGTNRIV